jgi:elongation factor P
MLAYNDLKKGTLFVLDGQPCEVLEYEFLRMQQRKPVTKTKIKNLITGKIVERNFHQNESFEEAEIEKKPLTYLYSNRGEYWFHEKGNPKARVSFKEDVVGAPAKFLKASTDVTALVFGETTIGIQVPIKVDLIVKEAPPGIKGDTAQGGTKTVVLETGATVNAPLFVNAGDLVRVNTESGEYVERMEKGKE